MISKTHQNHVDVRLATLLFSSTSILFPRTTYSIVSAMLALCKTAKLTKGKLSGSLGEAWIKNSSLQLSNVSKLFELLTS